MSEGDLMLGRGPGQPQRRPHLEGGELPGEVVVAAASGHLSDVRGPLRLVCDTSRSRATISRTTS